MGINDEIVTSKSGLEFISKWEGCILKPYKDIAGLRTIGIGHLIKPGENFPNNVEITKEKALEILASDVKICESSIKTRIKVPLNQNQFDALVSFGFNCGTGVYVQSDACKALNEGKYDEVPLRLLVWCKARVNGVLRKNQGLYNRRKSEGELFVKPAIQQSLVKLIPWTKKSLTEAQNCLTKLGLYNIRVDGLWGPSTSAAITKFALDKKIDIGPNPRLEITETLFETLKKA